MGVGGALVGTEEAAGDGGELHQQLTERVAERRVVVRAAAAAVAAAAAARRSVELQHTGEERRAT